MDDSLCASRPSSSAFMRGVSRLNLWLAWLSGLVLVAATTLVFLEILSRVLFDHSLVWVIELSEYSLLYMTFLGAPYLLEKHRHVAIDLITDALPEWARRLLVGVLCALAAVACGYCTWVGGLVTLDQFEYGMRETTLMRPPSYLITMVFPLGMLLLTIQFVAQTLDSFKR
ncbi:TRAP transporter small permease [Halomonas organivorans]|uniref:TRAP transporter small permease protein n=1 Tax=Halomonas organivorans TaxID=257772 RepID=A0A7W5BYD7_9GAMM|nr:TRAP transporter small permease [Halomonas organivorans]MBB3141390.1 TRAP-type C4-dicarboxylate transport system permease small subunit [Halomonas organivorans]